MSRDPKSSLALAGPSRSADTLTPVLPAYRRREIKRPKAYVTDTGMLAALIGASVERIATDSGIRGMAFETFAVMELVKLSGWAEQPPRIFHYRDRDQREIDIVLERPDGVVVGVEVKAAATATSADFGSLRFLRDRLGTAFLCGIVLYAGTRSLPFGDQLAAVPLSCLWHTSGSAKFLPSASTSR